MVAVSTETLEAKRVVAGDAEAGIRRRDFGRGFRRSLKERKTLGMDVNGVPFRKLRQGGASPSLTYIQTCCASKKKQP